MTGKPVARPTHRQPNSAPLIHQKMVLIMRDVEAIKKEKETSGSGSEFRFRYRGIDDAYNALHTVFAEHGVYNTSEIVSESRDERQTLKTGKNGASYTAVTVFTRLKIRFTFRAEDGSSVSTETLGEGADSGDKASNKAMSIAHKYALLQAFLIPTEDIVDPDAQTHEIVNDDEERIRNLAYQIQGEIKAAQTIDDLDAAIERRGIELESIRRKSRDAHTHLDKIARDRRALLTGGETEKARPPGLNAALNNGRTNPGARQGA